MALGILDIDVILDLPAEKFLGWLAYFRIEPFGEVRQDLRAGLQAALTVNCNQWGESAKPAYPEDFYATLNVPKKPQTVQEAIAIAKTTTLMMGGEVK